MEREPEIIVGLDIGTTKIAVIVGRKLKSGRFEILGVGKTDSTGVQRGMVINIAKTTDAIKLAVEEAKAKSKVNICEVYVGIAGQHIKSMQSRGSLMCSNPPDNMISQNDIRTLENNMYNLNTDPGEKIIEVLAQEYFLDNTPAAEPVGMIGKKLEANFHIITAQVSNIQNIAHSVQRAGLKVKGIILEPYASAEAVLDEKDKEAGVVLIDIGGGTTDIAIFKDNIIRHTAVIPMGGNIISSDIQEGCSIMHNHAETLKVKFGSCLASQCSNEDIVAIPGLRGRAPKEIGLKNLAGIIQARMEEILELAMNEIIASGYKGKLLGGAVLTGGGAMMKHIQQLTAFKLAMDTRIGIPNEHLAPNHDKTLEHPMYATGIGLVIEGLKRELEELGIPVQKPEPEKVEAPTPEHEEPADPKGGKGTKANKIKDKDKSIEPKKNRFTEWLYKFILIDNEANENDLK